MRILILLLLLAAPAAADIQADVEFLASDELRGRASGSPGIKTAQKFIIARLETLGIPVTTQKVGDCQNVIATIKGAQPETYIVVGAHLDHMGVKKWRGEEYIQNGADDNASGCASILELAERVNRTKTLRSVVFVWFTREETGMNGSRDFVDANPAP
ncbi:MAG: M28 family peptidase, partial [Planctomycetota bacterium]